MVKSLDVIRGVFALTYQQVLLGVLGNLILIYKGADCFFSLVLITVDVSVYGGILALE